MTTCDVALRLPPAGDQTKARQSQFFAGLTLALNSGLRSVQQGVERFEKVVKEYCVEFEPQVAMVTVRITR